MHKEALQKSWKRTEWSVRNSGAVAELALWECISDRASPFKVPRETGATSSYSVSFFLKIPVCPYIKQAPYLFASLPVRFSDCYWFFHFSGYTLLSVRCCFFRSSFSPLGQSGPSAIQQFLVDFFVKWGGKHFLCSFFGSSVCHLAVSAIV